MMKATSVIHYCLVCLTDYLMPIILVHVALYFSITDQKSGLVFGISLCKCVSNDVELRRRKPFLEQRKDSLELMSVAHHIGR